MLSPLSVFVVCVRATALFPGPECRRARAAYLPPGPLMLMISLLLKLSCPLPHLPALAPNPLCLLSVPSAFLFSLRLSASLPCPPRSLLRAGPVTSRGVALLRPLEVGGVLSLAEQPGRVLRQRGVALKGLGGREGQLPQEVRQRGVGAGREGLDERREVRVELGEVPEGRGV